MLQGDRDKYANFEPLVLIYKPLLLDFSFDELRFKLAVILGHEVLVSAVGAITAELCPGTSG